MVSHKTIITFALRMITGRLFVSEKLEQQLYVYITFLPTKYLRKCAQNGHE